MQVCMDFLYHLTLNAMGGQMLPTLQEKWKLIKIFILQMTIVLTDFSNRTLIYVLVPFGDAYTINALDPQNYTAQKYNNK